MANSLTTRGTLAFGQKEYVVRVGSFRKGQMALRLEAKDAEQSYRQEPKRRRGLADRRSRRDYAGSPD